jgi:hypothetical protein
VRFPTTAPPGFALPEKGLFEDVRLFGGKKLFAGKKLFRGEKK